MSMRTSTSAIANGIGECYVGVSWYVLQIHFGGLKAMFELNVFIDPFER